MTQEASDSFLEAGDKSAIDYSKVVHALIATISGVQGATEKDVETVMKFCSC